MSIFSRIRSALGTLLKTVPVDPIINTTQTQPIERFSDPIRAQTYKDMNDAEVDVVIRVRKIDKLIKERDRDREHYDTNDWKDWRERYDAIQ